MADFILPRFTMSVAEAGDLHRHVTTPDGAVLTQRRPDGSLHRAAKHYRMTDPVLIARQLEDRGFRVGRCVSLFSHGRFEPRGTSWKPSAWRYGLEVLFPEGRYDTIGAKGDLYRKRMRILLAHNGREALRIADGELRLNCTNQFTACVVSIRHTDREIDRFLADPARFLLELAGQPGDTVRRIDALRGVRVPDVFYTAMDSYPRVFSAVRRELNRNYRQGDFWALSQALTGSRQARALRASMALLKDGFPEALEARKGCGLEPAGALPEYFDCWARPAMEDVTPAPRAE